MSKKKRIVQVMADWEAGAFKIQPDDLPHDLIEYINQGHQVQLTRYLPDGRIEFTAGDFVLRVTAKIDIPFNDVGALVNEVLGKTDHDWKRATVMLSVALAEASYHSKTDAAEVSWLLKQAREQCPIGEVRDHPDDHNPPTMMLL